MKLEDIKKLTLGLPGSICDCSVVREGVKHEFSLERCIRDEKVLLHRLRKSNFL